jgi:hypothetical protein
MRRPGRRTPADNQGISPPSHQSMRSTASRMRDGAGLRSCAIAPTRVSCRAMEQAADPFTTFITSAPAPVLLSFALTAVLVAIKKTPVVPDWIIPFIAFTLGAAGYSILAGLTAKNFVIGICIGGSSVGIHQAIRQGLERNRTGAESDETREFRRRMQQMTDDQVARASQAGGEQKIVVLTPPQPAKVEVITKEPSNETKP